MSQKNELFYHFDIDRQMNPFRDDIMPNPSYTKQKNSQSFLITGLARILEQLEQGRAANLGEPRLVITGLKFSIFTSK